jgi:hypothetical protein
MTKSEMQKLKEYIEINQWYMTEGEMAEERGLRPSQIDYVCNKFGFTPIKIADRIRDFILANTDMTLEEQAQQLNIGVAALKYHYNNLDISYITRKPGPKGKGELVKASISQNEPVKQTNKLANALKEIVNKYGNYNGFTEFSDKHMYNKMGFK